MFTLLKLVLSRALTRRFARFSRTFSRFVEIEAQYTSAVAAEALQAAVVIATAVVVLCSLFIALAIAGLAAVVVLVPSYAPRSSPGEIISILLVVLALVAAATSVFIIWYYRRAKRIFTEYRLHWTSGATVDPETSTKLTRLHHQALVSKDRCIKSALHPSALDDQSSRAQSLLEWAKSEAVTLTQQQPLAAVLSAIALGGLGERIVRSCNHVTKDQIERVKLETTMLLRSNIERRAVAFLANGLNQWLAAKQARRNQTATHTH